MKVIAIVLSLATAALAGQQPGGGQGGGGQQSTIRQFNDQDIGFAYIPDRTFELTAAIELEAQQRQEEDRPFFITFSLGENENNEGKRQVRNPGDANDTVVYQLLSPVSGEELLDFDASSNLGSGQVLTGVIPGTSRQGNPNIALSLDIVLRIEEGQLENADPDYSDVVEMKLYYGEINDPSSYDVNDPDEEATLDVNGNVDPVVNLALVDPGAGFPGAPGQVQTERDMDFGILEPGAVREYDLLVESNTLFGITVISDNNGVLQYQGTATDSDLPDTVPYRFTLAGNEVDLSGGETTAATDTSGFRWPLAVEILEFGVPLAGDYEDVITITVSAQE